MLLFLTILDPFENHPNPRIMFRSALLAAILGSAAAFAPQQASSRSTALSGSFDNEIGVQAPLGFFDPLGYLEDGDQERFEHLRWVELKVSPIFCTDPCNWTIN